MVQVTTHSAWNVSGLELTSTSSNALQLYLTVVTLSDNSFWCLSGIAASAVYGDALLVRNCSVLLTNWSMWFISSGNFSSSIILFESIFLSLGGGLLGWVGGHTLNALASNKIERKLKATRDITTVSIREGSAE